MRLQVFVSSAGLFSRRGAVDIITSGKISVNNRSVFEPSFKVDPEKDNILFNGKRIHPRKKLYIMLHKPKGVITTRKDPFAKKTVMELLPHRFRHLNPVGRLDKDTTGLLLLTNDGTFINILTHPRFNIEKIYAVRLDRPLIGRDKRQLEKGLNLGGEHTAPCRIRSLARKGVEITIHEGRKRQIKRMFSKVGYTVIELKRLKEGFLNLGELPEGGWRFLTPGEIDKMLYRTLGGYP